MKSKIMNLSKDDLIIAMTNKKSWNDVLRHIGVNFRSGNNLICLKDRIASLGLEFKPILRNPNLKTDIFEVIDSKEKAYWLGFLMADGYVTDRKINLRLSIKDEEQVIKFVKFVGGELNNIRKFIDTNGYSMVEFCLTNRKIASNLNQLGCKSPKANNLRLLQFTDECYTLSVLMGFYDGDGQEYNPTVCSGSELFLNEIKIQYGLKPKIRFLKNNWGQCYELYLGKIMLKKLMDNYPDSMPRKRKQIYGYSICKCGKPLMNKKTVYCSSCFPRKSKKFFVSKDELEKMLKDSSMVKVAKQLGVSDNSVKKRCILLKIDYKSIRKYK